MKGKANKILEFLLGIIITALAYELFLLPNNLVYGVGGVAVILKNLFSWDTNIVIFTGSIILLIMSYILLGKNQSRKSLVGSILYPVFVYLISLVLPQINYDVEPIVLTVFGAALTGLGLGLVMRAGYTTGGTDILNQIVAKYGKKNLGTAMLLSDGVIIICSLFTLGVTEFIYSIITIYIISMVTDKVLLGISNSKTFYVITEHETSVKKFIMSTLSHGVTILDGRGGYTGDNKKIIMCIIPTKEYVELKEGILKIDKNALLLITDAYEVHNEN